MNTKKEIEKRIKIMISFVIVIILGGCAMNESVLEEHIDAQWGENIQLFISVDYVDYDKIIAYSDSPYFNDQRYADVTSDGVVNWSESRDFDERSDLPKLFEKIAVNGNAVQFPMRFADLNLEYAAFGKMNLENVEYEKLDLIIEHKQNHHQAIFTKEPLEREHKLYEASMFQHGIAQVDVFFRAGEHNDEHEIVGLRNEITFAPTMYDVRIANIGVGSTFNEMYEALGPPTQMETYEDGNRYAHYRSANEQYTITFTSGRYIINPVGKYEVDLFPNVITRVTIKNDDISQYEN